MSKVEEDYGLSPEKEKKQMAAPPVDYLPRWPKTYRPKIGLIGAGGISDFHLKNYRHMGLEVVAIANRTLSKAEKRKADFYPQAEVCQDYRQLLDRNDIEVLDITPHPKDRLPIIREALQAGKHVLSQKPFVLDLDEGQKLVDLAKKQGVKLAINQNGRWAPHFSYMRQAIGSGLIGRPVSVDLSLQWDQTWATGSAFEEIRHMILYDFAIHWFDIAACFMQGQRALRVYASAVGYQEQMYRPPALASCIIDYEQAQVRMGFNAHTVLGEEDMTTVVGTRGTLRSRGPGLNEQPMMEVFTEAGEVKVPLQGSWFENGFQGTMGELLCAIEEDREPANSAASNLESLALCFAALESADRHQPIVPGSVRRIE
ncbi:MAG: Gfo/Idh/MocA family protein [Cyclobacteriaceae bacterium]